MFGLRGTSGMPAKFQQLKTQELFKRNTSMAMDVLSLFLQQAYSGLLHKLRIYWNTKFSNPLFAISHKTGALVRPVPDW